MDAKTSPQGTLANWLGLIVCLLLGATVFGVGYWLGHHSLLEPRPAPTASIPHPSWNPSPITSPAHPLTPPAPPPLQVNVSPEMKEFLQNRATLNAKMQQLRTAGNGAPNPQLFAQFQKDNAALLKRQKELSQIIAQQQAKNPMSAPPPLQIPPNASPQLKTLLTARDQLMRDQIAFMNQHRADDPAQRQAAMQQWRQQNAARIAQLQQDEKALPQSTSPKQPSPVEPVSPTSSTSPK